MNTLLTSGSPMSRRTTHPYAQAMAHAIELAGGVDALAQSLGLSRLYVRACLTAGHEIPVLVFLKIVDFLQDSGEVSAPESMRPPPPLGSTSAP